MRAIASVSLVLAACVRGQSQPVVQADTGPAADAGSDVAIDAGAPVDKGAVAATDGGIAAGPPPASIDAGPCPGLPPALWTRTVTALQAEFSGVSDSDGNLYWVEYQPSYASTPEPAWLVSADRDGHDRYREPISTYAEFYSLMFAAGEKAIVMTPTTVQAYDLATGAASWAIDFGTKYQGGGPTGGLDVGNGDALLGFQTYGGSNDVYLVSSTGATIWSGAGKPLATNKAGSALIAVSTTSAYAGILYVPYMDLLMIDAAGQQQWRQTLQTRGVLSWTAEGPWLSSANTASVSVQPGYVSVPDDWFAAAGGVDVGFGVAFGAANSPDVVDVVRSGAIVAQGALPGTNPENGLASFPFASADHVVVIGEVWHGSPGMCYPEQPGAAFMARFDAASSWQCPMGELSNQELLGVAALPDRLVLGYQPPGSACGDWAHVHPVTIEAIEQPN